MDRTCRVVALSSRPGRMLYCAAVSVRLEGEKGLATMELTARTASRRRFLMTAAALAGSAALAACSPPAPAAPAEAGRASQASRGRQAGRAAADRGAGCTRRCRQADRGCTSPLAARQARRRCQAGRCRARSAAPRRPQSRPAQPDADDRAPGPRRQAVQPGLWSPYAVGSNTSDMNQIIFEPMAYFSVFANKEILWTAESYEYAQDFKQLTIKIRNGHQLERRQAVHGRGRRLHVHHPQDARRQGALGLGRRPVRRQRHGGRSARP